MQEGRAFEQRLRIIIEQKLCKKKFQLIADSDDVSVVPAAAVAVIAATADAEVKKVKKTKKMVEEEQRKKEEEDERALEEIELRKASSSEMRQEVTTLTAEIFKGLTSAVAPLRPVALSALLCITRAAVSTPNTDAQCRAVMSSSLQAAFVDFSTKKNCRLNPKIFDELIQRFPDFCISSFLVHLIPSCENAKSSFLRAECCRFLGEILKRHKSLQKSSLEVLSSSLKSIVTTLGGALTFNFSSPSIIEADGGSTGSNNKKEEKNKIKAAAAMLTVPSEDKDSSTRGASSKEISAEKEKETRAKRLKPLLMCTKELAGLFKSQSLSQSLANKDQEDALKALIAVMQSESISGSTTSSPAVVRLVEQVLQILKTVGAASSVSSKAEGVKGKEMKPLNTAVSVVENKSNIKRKDEKKEAKKVKREVSEDKMVLSANEREQEESDDALPVGEYVEVGAKGPNFKKKKGGKKEAKEDQQEILDVAEKKLVKKMHEEKRKRAENEDVERDGVVEVEKKRKWHE